MKAKKVKENPWLAIDAAALAVCLALAGAAYALGLKPLLTQHAQRAALQATVTAKRSEANKVTGALAKLKQQLVTLKKAIADEPLQLEPADQVNQRLVRLTNLGVASGLTIDAIQPEASSHGARFQTVPIRLSGTGTFRHCAKFLHELRRQFPDTGVAMFSLKGDPTTEGSPLRFRFYLLWHAAPSERNPRGS